MNKNQQLLIAQFFAQLCEAEHNINSKKILLLNCNHFNPLGLFDLIAQQKNKITLKDLVQYFHYKKIRVFAKQLYDIVSRMDISRSGNINYYDMIKFMLPLGCSQSPSTSNHASITTEFEERFIDLISTVIERFRIVDVARKELHGIEVYNIFDHIGVNRTGYLGIQQFKIFLMNNDYDLSPSNLRYLMEAFRKRTFVHINLQVLIECINPYQIEYYSNFKNQIQSLQHSLLQNKNKLEEQALLAERQRNTTKNNQQRKIERRLIANLKKQRAQQCAKIIHKQNQAKELNAGISQPKEYLGYSRAFKRFGSQEKQNIFNVTNSKILNKAQSKASRLNSIDKNYRLPHHQLNEITEKQNQFISYPSSVNKKQLFKLQDNEKIAEGRESFYVPTKLKQSQEILNQQNRLENSVNQRESLRRQIRIERLTKQKQAMYCKYPRSPYLIQQQLKKSKDQQQRDQELFEQERKRRKFQLQKQLQKTRIQLQVRRNRIELQAKMKEEEAQLDRLKRQQRKMYIPY